jgi:small subunit ribosomal protein S21
LKVYVRRGETREEKEKNLEEAMLMFKRKVNRSGILLECRKREYYVKPGIKRRLKHENAMKELRKIMKKRGY